jgi:long-chain acyl-CoA synthetase
VNAIHSLIDAAQEVPEKVALRSLDASYTYGELNLLSARFAAGLRRFGIRSGQRVALYFTNAPEFIICYLGIVRIGAIAVSINPALRPDEVNYILSDCSASLLLAGEEAQRTFKAEQKGFCEVIVCNLKAAETGFFRRWLEDASPMFEAAVMEDDDPLAILYTSGTTGFPKGATLTHGNIAFTARSAMTCFGTTPADRLLLMVPVSHCFGQNLILNHSLAARATIVLVNGFEPARFTDVIERERVSLVFAVPAIYSLLLEAKVLPEQLGSVRYYHSGAAGLSEEVAAAWLARFSVPIHQGYGLTETSPFASYNTAPEKRPTSIGRPIPGVEMRIVDECGRIAGVNDPGEILIHGPNVMKGYWNRDADMRGVDSDGWLHSGDLAVRDEAGDYYLVDRIKDVINISGLKVFPAEVERVLATHPAVLDAGVFGSPDPVFGEKVSAKVVLREGQSVHAEELAALCRDKLALFKVPDHIAITDSLPRNGAGKLLRRVLRQTI